MSKHGEQMNMNGSSRFSVVLLSTLVAGVLLGVSWLAPKAEAQVTRQQGDCVEVSSTYKSEYFIKDVNAKYAQGYEVKGYVVQPVGDNFGNVVRLALMCK
jgi:hypothetical protein